MFAVGSSQAQLSAQMAMMHAAQQQQQRGGIDRLAAAGLNPLASGGGNMMNMGLPGGGAAAGQSLPPAQSGMPRPRGQQPAMTAPPTIGAMGNSSVGAPGVQPRDNLSKWFGNDMMKQSLGNMPSLPPHGQKVITLEELERRQQTVTN